MGLDAPIGGRSASPLMLLDDLVSGSDRNGPYDHPHHDWSVRRQPSDKTRGFWFLATEAGFLIF